MSKKEQSAYKFNYKMKKKLMVVFITIIIGLFSLGMRLMYINNTKGDNYTVKVLAQQQYSTKTLPYKRGDISDRNGVTLATSIKVYNLVLDPKIMLTDSEKYLDKTVSALIKCFPQLVESDLRTLISQKSTSSYVVQLKKLTYDEIKEFQKLMNDDSNIKGVWFEEEYERKYPFSSLACSLIGFVDAGNVGNWGIEGYYNSYLNGTDGREYGYVNNDNNMEKIIKNADDGYSIISTIDYNIQSIVEKHIKECVEIYTPKNVGVVLMNPNNGEIYAMASNTSYDLNNPRDLTKFYTTEQISAMTDEETIDAYNKIWRNYCISDTYEPGSTIKPFTVATALEENKINLVDTYVCDGFEEVGGWRIKCHKTTGHGTLTLKEVLAQSCNDAIMQIADKMGPEIFCEYQTRFGFGSKTGVDLPGEASCEGLLHTSKDMGVTDLATNSFGQNFNVTMIQMVSGFASIINGGNYYEPHIVKTVLNSQGGVIESIGKNVVKQTVTQSTSNILKESMRLCVTGGSGKAASVEGYEISGKTGTAEKLPRGEDKYVVSFMGFAPYDTPQVICYVIVDEPNVKGASASIASGVFKDIMTEVLPYMNVFTSVDDVASTDTNTDTTDESYGSGGFSNESN